MADLGKLSWKTSLLLCVLTLMFSLSRNFVSSVFGAEIVTFGEVNIRLYVVALDGVDAHGVGNISNMVEGVLSASSVNSTRSWLSPLFELKFGEVKINTSTTVIHDWDKYREVVETGSNIIVVNAHGETVPVPADYMKEEWADKIADAMAYRNVTWVHTTGYPFYYYYHQESGEGEWGEEGFKQLMSHIGKNNVTCHPLGSETEKIRIHEDAEYTLFHGWYEINNAFGVERGKPLNASDFRDCLVAVIWGTRDYYMTGAIVKFAKASQVNNFGFYVHIGTRKTFTSGHDETDGDYYRGYVGTAQAIYTFSFRTASEEAISNAEEAIVRAENEGRTRGISEARRLLRQAKEDYTLSHYVSALKNANNAIKAANNATKPSFVEAYALPLAILNVVSIAIATSLVVRWKKNSKKESETK